jgi:monothiol glutaredoxin
MASPEDGYSPGGTEVDVGLLSRIGKKLKVLRRDDAPQRAAPAAAPRRATQDEDVDPPSPRPAGQPAREFVEQTVKSHDVVLFMKGSPAAPRCGFSANAAGILSGTGVPFHTVDVLSDEAIREGVKEYSNWPTIPQIFVHGQFVGGSDILAELHASGELHKMLASKGSA